MKILYAVMLTLLVTLCVYGQSSPSPKDTTYVFNLLKKGEAVEKKNITDALAFYRKAFAYSKKTNNTKGYFDSVRLLAYALNNLGQHDEALKIAKGALRKARQDTSKRNIGLSHFAIASTSLYTGDYETAIANYKEAAGYLRATGNKANEAAINQNLGYIYAEQHMFGKAIEYYRKSLAYDTTASDRRAVAVDYFSIGVALDSDGKISESKKFYLKALEYVDQENDLDFMISIYNNISGQYNREARYDSAMYYQKEALRMSRELGSPRHELHLLAMMAETQNLLKNYSEATRLLDQSHAIAQKSNASLREFRNIYAEYATASEGRGDYKAATRWLNKYVESNDSLITQDNKELLQDYEVKLKKAESAQQLAEKERQIDQLEFKSERQKFWLLVAALAGFVVMGGLLFAYLYAHQRRLAANSALVAAQRENELAIVQSELQGQKKERLRISKEMHDDLGASLTAIGLLSEVAKRRMGAETTPEIEKISSISAEMVTAMNEIIWSLNNKNDSLNGLIAYTRSYASEFIENTNLILRTNVEESPYELTMRGADRRNVFLTVKEALNNVVKHAQATKVTLTILPEKDRLRIEVADDGRGFVAKSEPGTRNGLGNMKDRMREVGGECEIIPSTRGTCVKITYPYPQAPKDKIMQMKYSE
ncbi:tetratricopeptide repeat-containing sensor histidine kinase [Persicitalea jodogahamensis]|uniref:histidine kinase n=1 Tax=Persicitalea jodogahamensis TaxID=402147 RepID=A0A8J3GAS4_9BACT|nr:histidine kinase [Persicitalea jodogahamensis]GHB76282.1 two-component sensor histidine kinase [Persicitalea jodogahamensis]